MQKRSGLKARPTAAITDIHVGALVWYVFAHLMAIGLAVPFFSWAALGMFYINYALLGSAVTLFAHRYFSHRSFKAPTWYENFMALAYTLSFNRCGEPLISWVAGHKFHHVYADGELDPHSPNKGLGHAFCGHFIWRRRDLYDFEEYKHYCPEFEGKTFILWLERNVVPLQIWLQLHVFLAGGLLGPAPGFDWHSAIGFYVWGVCVRWTFSQLAASFVDTFSHGVGIFNRLPDTWQTNTRAKNNFLYWTMTLGNETWHNTHHAFPSSYRNGYRWYHWDIDSAVMYWGAKLGLLSELKESKRLKRLTSPGKRSHESSEEVDHDASSIANITS